jgi:hypothetical protein
MRLTISLMCMALTGCPGEAPPNTNNDVDAGTDAPPAVEAKRLTGKVLDYFSPTDIMDAVALASDGIDPPLSATSVATGDYEFAEVPIGSKIYFTATRANYRATRNAAVSIADMDVVQDLYVMSNAETLRQYTTTGTTEVANTAFVAAELKRNNGMPFEGLQIDGATPQITLVDANDAIVPGVSIFGFGATDLIPDDIAVTQTTAIAGGKVRVGLLNVPEGQFTLKLSYLDNNNQPQTTTAPVVTKAGAATILVAQGMGGGGGGGGMPNPAGIANPTFEAHIYPLLQKPAAGGLGCASCHTANGTAGSVLQYDLPAADTLAAIKARANVVVLVAGTEATSLFLTKPLYEPAPVNHPNATFLDVNDAYYQLFLRWITQGAL